MKKVIIILLYLVSSALVAMEEEKSAPDDFTQTEKIFESYENNGSKCTCCLFTELPALKIQPLGDPLIDVEAIMRATVYGQWALSLSQEAKNQEVYKLLRDSRRAAFFDKDVVLKGYPHLRRHWAILVAAGADANVKDNNTSLLKTAILCEDRQFADFLLRHKANVNKESVHEEWPIFCAKDEEMAALLVSYGADVKIRGGAWGRSLVQEAIERSQAGKSVDLIKYYLGQGVDINATNDNEGTVLHSLAYGSADYQEKKILLETAELILLAGVRLDVKNKWGKTAEDILRGKLQYASVEPRLSVEQQTNIEALLSMIVQEPQRRTAQIVKMIS